MSAPSKAALELAMSFGPFMQDGAYVQQIATMIQSSMDDLLEKTKRFCETYRAANPDWFKTLGGSPANFAEMESALEPWKPA